MPDGYTIGRIYQGYDKTIVWVEVEFPPVKLPDRALPYDCGDVVIFRDGLRPWGQDAAGHPTVFFKDSMNRSQARVLPTGMLDEIRAAVVAWLAETEA
jgi:hypothetical protein